MASRPPSKTGFLIVAFALGASAALYSCTTARVDTSTDESRRAINAEGSKLIDEGREIFRPQQEKAELIEFLKSI